MADKNLISAIEAGNAIKARKILQKLILEASIQQNQFDINESFTHGESTTTFIDFAWSMKHFDIVLILLEANSKFPQSIILFDGTIMPKILKNFMKTTNDFHKYVDEENIQKLTEIIEQNQHLKHFYDKSNNSAICHAIIAEKFEVFEFLLSKNIQVSPKEQIFKQLSKNQKNFIKNLSINFQGKQIQLKNLLGKNLKPILNDLSASWIIKILKKEAFDVGEELKMNFCAQKRGFYSKIFNFKISDAKSSLVYSKFIVVVEFPKSGRTTAVIQMAMNVKEEYPEKWVAYVDLKSSWSQEFKNFEDVKKLLYKNEFEEVIFMHCLSNKSLVIVWDGVDELQQDKKQIFFGKFLIVGHSAERIPK